MQNDQIFKLFGRLTGVKRQVNEVDERSVAAAKMATDPKSKSRRKVHTKKNKASEVVEWDDRFKSFAFDSSFVTNEIDLQMQELSNESLPALIAVDELSNECDISFHSIGSMLTVPDPVLNLMELPRVYPCRVEKEEWFAAAVNVNHLKQPELGTSFPRAHIPLVIKPDATRENGLKCDFVLCEAYFHSDVESDGNQCGQAALGLCSVCSETSVYCAMHVNHDCHVSSRECELQDCENRERSERDYIERQLAGTLSISDEEYENHDEYYDALKESDDMAGSFIDKL
jgi:hypothetical protein